MHIRYWWESQKEIDLTGIEYESVDGVPWRTPVRAVMYFQIP
jgi:hypothetical protein